VFSRHQKQSDEAKEFLHRVAEREIYFIFLDIKKIGFIDYTGSQEN